MICMEVDGMKRVLFKVILPLVFIVVWIDMCYWICLGENGRVCQVKCVSSFLHLFTQFSAV